MADRLFLVFVGLCLGTAWADDEVAEAETTSDVEFIEYLGMWAESDDEWLMFDEQRDDEETPEMEPEAENES